MSFMDFIRGINKLNEFDKNDIARLAATCHRTDWLTSNGINYWYFFPENAQDINEIRTIFARLGVRTEQHISNNKQVVRITKADIVANKKTKRLIEAIEKEYGQLLLKRREKLMIQYARVLSGIFTARADNIKSASSANRKYTYFFLQDINSDEDRIIARYIFERFSIPVEEHFTCVRGHDEIVIRVPSRHTYEDIFKMINPKTIVDKNWLDKQRQEILALSPEWYTIKKIRQTYQR